jgi:hypothetical protein
MSRDAYIAGRSGSKSYAGSGGSSNASFQAGQQERQRDQSNQQSRQSQPKDNRSGNEKAADQLARLQNQGKGATNQAEDLKYRLASSDAKADQFHADGRPMSYYEKLNAAYSGQIPGFLQDNIQSQVQNYQNNPPKLEPKEITLADGTKMTTYGSFEPGQFSNAYNQYMQALKYGSTPGSFDPVDLEQGLGTLKPASDQFMDYGFGSVFGSSTGSTASSAAVQSSLITMMQDLYDQGYSTTAAGEIAMDKMYPGYLNYAQGKGDIPVNFMDMNVGLPLPGHVMVKDYFTPQRSGGSGFGGSGGGFNYGYGSGGGGGGGGGFGYNMNMGMQGQPKQRAQIGPGGLQEQVNQAFLSGGKPFAKGGIVSLVED